MEQLFNLGRRCAQIRRKRAGNQQRPAKRKRVTLHGLRTSDRHQIRSLSTWRTAGASALRKFGVDGGEVRIAVAGPTFR